MSLSTRDGNVLLFNLNLSALAREQVMFPADPNGLTDDYARTLFAMSSPLPGYMCELATSHGIPVRPGARGFVFNAGVAALVRSSRPGLPQGAVAATLRATATSLTCPAVWSAQDQRQCTGGAGHTSFYGSGLVNAAAAVR